MSKEPISPLRQRMIEDMSLRNFGEKTRHDYIRHVRTFTAFLGRSRLVRDLLGVKLLQHGALRRFASERQRCLTFTALPLPPAP